MRSFFKKMLFSIGLVIGLSMGGSAFATDCSGCVPSASSGGGNQPSMDFSGGRAFGVQVWGATENQGESGAWANGTGNGHGWNNHGNTDNTGNTGNNGTNAHPTMPANGFGQTYSRTEFNNQLTGDLQGSVGGCQPGCGSYGGTVRYQFGSMNAAGAMHQSQGTGATSSNTGVNGSTSFGAAVGGRFMMSQ